MDYLSANWALKGLPRIKALVNKKWILSQYPTKLLEYKLQKNIGYSHDTGITERKTESLRNEISCPIFSDKNLEGMEFGF